MFKIVLTIYLSSFLMFPRKNFPQLSNQCFTHPSQEIISLIRIYLSRKITAPYFFTQFTEDAINMLTVYVYRLICFLVGKIKSILVLQRRTIPNALHSIIAIHSAGADVGKFSMFLGKRLQFSLSGKISNRQILEREQMKGLMKKFTYMFEEEVEQFEKVNIYSVPNFCIPVQNPLPIQSNFTKLTIKPHPLSYLKVREHLKAHNSDPSEVEMKIVQSEKNAKVCLGEIRKIKKDTSKSEKEVKESLKPLEEKRKKFTACQFL